MLTQEEKERMKPFLMRTARAILEEVTKISTIGLIEVVCDADRPVFLGNMPKSDYDRLAAEYNDPDTRRWLRQTFKGWRT